jgi:hypothetical protein
VTSKYFLKFALKYVQSVLGNLLPHDLGYRVIQNEMPLLPVSNSFTLFEYQGNVPLSKLFITLSPTLILWHITVNKFTEIYST